MQIQLPDDLKLPACAAAAGFSNVEDYIRALIERETSTLEAESTDVGSRRLSREQWDREFQELLAMAKPRNPHMDDSRESIYSDR